jgi:hypothetical protein
MPNTNTSTTARPATRTRALALCLSLTGLVVGCSDRRLVPIEDATLTNVDDLVDIEAEFCARRTEEVTFPVKILLVLDGSGSLQFTDQSGLRRAAVRDLMSSLARQPDVYVATMGFGSNIYLDPPISPGAPTFIPASDWVEPAFLSLADIQTNYHGALSAVRSHLLMDLLASDPAEVARTKYVIIFFSDGAPTPKCCISAEETLGARGEFPFGCAPEPYETDAAGIRYCEGEEEQTICNDVDWLDNYRDINNSDETPDFGDGTLEALNELEPNDNYNRTYQIEDLVRETVELGETFGVGELRLHTALLFDSTLPDAVKEIYRLNRCRSEGLLRRMAELGNGVFRDFENSDDIDFLSFNFTALQRGYSLMANYVVNMGALATAEGFTTDTDMDGLSDEAELGIGTDSTVADSDRVFERPNITETPTDLPREEWGDGYSDFIENAFQTTGFDPRYQSLPITPCPDFDPLGADKTDIDFDGLNGCEEVLFETDPERADSDGDGLPDGLEVRLGLDPALHEGDSDSDFDGEPNFREVRRGSNPLLPDGRQRDGMAYRYELIEGTPTDDGRPCYTSVVRDVRLVPTAPRLVGGRRGFNDLYMWISEVPTDNPTGRTDLRFACARTQYIPPSFKDPAQGLLRFVEEDFYDLSNADDVAELLSGVDPCIGKALQ